MEYERAIYRVYERCLDGLREDDPDTLSPKSCRFIESLVLSFAVFLLASLIYLHIKFVGQSGCLPSLLRAIPNPISNNTELIYKNQSYYNSSSFSHYTALNLRKDQILQIDVDRRFLSSSVDTTTDDMIAENEEVSIINGLTNTLFYNDITNYLTTNINTILSYNITRNLINSNKTSNHTHHITRSNHPAHGHSYEFAYSISILALNEETRKSHNFDVFNVTLAGSECFGDVITMSLIPLGGIDTIIRNFLQYTYHNNDGIVITSSGDYITWNKNENKIIYSKYINKYISYRITILLVSFFSFFMLSTISALLVRILISSGVVLLFPLFWLVQRFSSTTISWRIISLSYPWIGIPIEVLRTRNQSIEPFIIAHISRIIVYYVLYEAAQLAFSVWFYNDSRPGQKELWIFAIMMLMIYLRSRGSIVLFPRVILCLYMIYHFYIYLHPDGFHLLALLVMFMFMAWNMIFCVRKFELAAYSNGYVNIDAPRVLHNRVPWPMWSTAIAPDFTLFWPLDNQSMTIYGTAFDNPTPTNTNPDNANPSTNTLPNDHNNNNDGGDVELGSSTNPLTNTSNSSSNETYTVSSPFLGNRRNGRGGYNQLPSTYNSIRSNHNDNEISDETIIDINNIDSTHDLLSHDDIDHDHDHNLNNIQLGDEEMKEINLNNSIIEKSLVSNTNISNITKSRNKFNHLNNDINNHNLVLDNNVI